MALLNPPQQTGGRWKDVPRRLDGWLALATIILIAVGLLSIFSVDYGRQGSNQFKKQLLNTVIGLVPFFIFYLTNPSVWRRYANVLYFANLSVLTAVLLIGTKVNGSRRWLDIGPIQFQPSEMAKLFTVLTLAAFFAVRLDDIKKLSTFLLSLAHVAVPLIFLLRQPHLGASLVLITIWLSICIAAGVNLKYVAGSAIVAIGLLVFAFFTPGVMSDYQRNRVLGLLFGNEKGNAYQQTRAEIAFGVGGLTGTGYLKGGQKQGQFIPEQHNDFIFTVVGEEGGLIGSTLVLSAFGFFFYRVWNVMFRATQPFHRMIAAGIFGMLSFHMVANLGMNLKLLPVVGLWLPFISAGGTAMWLCLACVGLLLNIQSREKEGMF